MHMTQHTLHQYSHLPTVQPTPGHPQIIIESALPVLQYRGRTYFMHRETEQEFRRVYFDSTRSWFLLHDREYNDKSSTFVLHAEYGDRPTRHAIVVWSFPIEYLQFRARLFLARRRESRRLALAMALHPRLGSASQLHAWLNEDALSKIGSLV